MNATITSSALLLFSLSASAQSLNIDFGVTYGGPANTHAAAGLAGEWNSLTMPLTGTPLVDLEGNAVAATVVTGLPNSEWTTNNSSTTGDDEALLDDFFDPIYGDSIYFSDLEDGRYVVLTYAWAPDDNEYRTDVDVVGSNDGEQRVGGPWTGTYAQGVQYAEHRVEVVGGDLEIVLTIGFEYASCNGVQLIKEDDTLGTNFCVTSPNSVSAIGATLSASGSTSLADESLTLVATDTPDQPAAFFFGPEQVAVPFGNGTRCVGGIVVRSPVVQGAGGVAEYALDFSLFGPVLSSLGTANFQCFYRDPAAGNAQFNLSNGLEVTFTP